MPLKNPSRGGNREGSRAAAVIDRSDESIVITCLLCAWRTCADDELPARRDLVIHLAQNHQGETAADQPRTKRDAIGTKDAQLRWLARRGVFVTVKDIAHL